MDFNEIARYASWYLYVQDGQSGIVFPRKQLAFPPEVGKFLQEVLHVLDVPG